GKTELMRSMIVSLALTNRQSKLQLALIDPKSRGFMPLAGLPHLIDQVASDTASTLALLERLIAEMERRDQENISSPHIVIAVDSGQVVRFQAAWMTAKDWAQIVSEW